MKNTKNSIKMFEESSALIAECSRTHAPVIEKIVKKIISCFQKGGKLFIFGNGGSASQAQHFSAEFVNKFLGFRAALPAIALTTDTSVLTSIGNDLCFDEIFARQIEALGKKGDIAWGLSTSGRSPNVLKGIEAAAKAGLLTISFTGMAGSRLSRLCDICLAVPSKNTPRIQEAHLCAGHAVCELVEAHFLLRNRERISGK